MINTDNILKFNTGRSYTAHGQRIAAISVDGGVFMQDRDRDVHYFFPGCALERNEIMRRYDNNENCKYSCDSVNEFGFWELIKLMSQDWFKAPNSLNINGLGAPRARKWLRLNVLRLARFLNTSNHNLARHLLAGENKSSKI